MHVKDILEQPRTNRFAWFIERKRADQSLTNKAQQNFVASFACFRTWTVLCHAPHALWSAVFYDYFLFLWHMSENLSAFAAVGMGILVSRVTESDSGPVENAIHGALQLANSELFDFAVIAKVRCVVRNKKQCSRQLQCEVPSSYVFSQLKKGTASPLSTCGYVAWSWCSASYRYHKWGGGGEGGGGAGGTGTSGPGCLYRTTTRCFAMKGLRTIKMKFYGCSAGVALWSVWKLANPLLCPSRKISSNNLMFATQKQFNVFYRTERWVLTRLWWTWYPRWISTHTLLLRRTCVGR